MWNIFEYPWTGIIVALAIQMLLTIIHIVKPNTRKLWHTAIPVIIIALAFGVDHFIKTDREKIELLITETLSATQAEDLARVEALFADDYDDSYNRSKEQIMNVCRKWLSKPFIEKNSLMGKQLELRDENAVVILSVVTQIEASNEASSMIKVLSTTSRISLAKYGDKWLIKGVQITQINGQPMRWGEF